MKSILLFLALIVLANCHWRRIPGGLSQISVGFNGLACGVNRASHIYCRQGVNGHWRRVPGGLRQVSVSKKDRTICGVNGSHHIYCRADPFRGNWVRIGGSLMGITVLRKGKYYGVNRHHRIYVSTWHRGVRVGWRELGGRLKQIAVGGNNLVCGVNGANHIYCRWGERHGWRRIPGGLNELSVGVTDNSVCGVNRAQHIYCRNAPFRGNWRRIPGGLTYITTYNKNTNWGVNGATHIYFRGHVCRRRTRRVCKVRNTWCKKCRHKRGCRLVRSIRCGKVKYCKTESCINKYKCAAGSKNCWRKLRCYRYRCGYGTHCRRVRCRKRVCRNVLGGCVRTKPLTLVGTCDNQLSVYVRGKRVHPYRGNERHWPSAKYYRTKVSKGDVIVLRGVNFGRYSRGNPAGIKAQVHVNGRWYFSNTHWRCHNSAQSNLYMKPGRVSRVWRSRHVPYRYPNIRGISNRATWIWSRNLAAPRVDCFFVVP